MSIDERSVLDHLVLDFRQMAAFAAEPWVFVRGEGVRLQDREGRWYLDGLSGVFVTGLGYGNERIIQAATDQLHDLHFAPPLHGTTPPAIELAMRLREIAPAGMRGEHGVAVKLLSGGSEATETALKMARQYHKQSGHPRKYKLIARYGGYHGGTMGALAASGGWERRSVFEPLVAGVLHTHPPACHRCPFDKTYDHGACGITCARLVERTIEAEDPETVAAIIMEPMSISSAGFVVPPREYFSILRAACDKHNVLLIFDEIITGFGRLGTWFGADYYGVAPDLLACGKGMSGGYAPLAGVLIADRVWQAFLGDPDSRREFHHGHTFAGNPVACAAGLATLAEYEERDLIAHAAQLGTHLRARLEGLAEAYPFVRDVRGAGLLQGFDLVADAWPEAATPPGKRFEALARERGLIARCGNDFIGFAPPLVMQTAELDELCDIAAACLEAMAP